MLRIGRWSTYVCWAWARLAVIALAPPDEWR
jgi:hypothetical protein